jgi:DNA polymerase-4
MAAVDPRRAVTWLFADLNAYFASVEQETRPELRGRPIGVVPVEADTTCCIAVSYEAKRYGLTGGIAVAKAKELCPHLVLVKARPPLYIEYHDRIKEAIERCVPIQQVMSCDEFACNLIGRECDPLRATEIAYAIKREIRTIGSTLRCSVGLGPNRFLAKVAADVLKPDGLMIFDRAMLPDALYGLKLSDIPGVGHRMEKRLTAAGITSVRQLCDMRRDQMSRLWGNVWGDRMWLWMHGEDFLEPADNPKQSFSRQHVLPPHCRNFEAGRAVSIKLMLSAARRMRLADLWACAVFLHVGLFGQRPRRAFQGIIRFAPSQSPAVLQEKLIELWKELPADAIPSDISVGVCELTTKPMSLFEEPRQDKRERTIDVLDRLNARYGLNSVYLGSIHSVRKEAPTRISFGAPPPRDEFEDSADRG